MNPRVQLKVTAGDGLQGSFSHSLSTSKLDMDLFGCASAAFGLGPGALGPSSSTDQVAMVCVIVCS